jgi:TolB protein
VRLNPYRMLFLFTTLFLGACSAAREPLLSNIEQLTTPAMGFEKAGEAYFSPDMRQIIFQAAPTGREHYQMYVMSLSDRRPRMVSTGRGECTCGYFRPDGQKIIFASSHLGPESAPAEHEGYHVGQRKYVWNFNAHMDIFEANPDGMDLRRITDAPGYDAEGAYSSDGRQIAFTSQRTGDLEIWLMNGDGSNPRQITHATGYDGGPFISPDGKRIIFRADRRGDDLLQLFVVGIDGQNERQLTNNQDVNWGPYWYPNGKSIVYATSRHGHQNYELYLMNIETGAECRVTNTPGFDGLPAFSPNGKKLMWTSKRGPDQTSEIFMADFKLPSGF